MTSELTRGWTSLIIGGTVDTTPDVVAESTPTQVGVTRPREGPRATCLLSQVTEDGPETEVLRAPEAPLEVHSGSGLGSSGKSSGCRVDGSRYVSRIRTLSLVDPGFESRQ